MPDWIEQSGNVYAVGAPCPASMAGQAKPDALGGHYAIQAPQYPKADELMRHEVHFRGNRASGGTFPALVTLIDDISQDGCWNSKPAGKLTRWSLYHLFIPIQADNPDQAARVRLIYRSLILQVNRIGCGSQPMHSILHDCLFSRRQPRYTDIRVLGSVSRSYRLRLATMTRWKAWRLIIKSNLAWYSCQVPATNLGRAFGHGWKKIVKKSKYSPANNGTSLRRRPKSSPA